MRITGEGNGLKGCVDQCGSHTYRKVDESPNTSETAEAVQRRGNSDGESRERRSARDMSMTVAGLHRTHRFTLFLSQSDTTHARYRTLAEESRFESRTSIGRVDLVETVVEIGAAETRGFLLGFHCFALYLRVSMVPGGKGTVMAPL